jgi:type VI secretion system protein ImpL
VLTAGPIKPAELDKECKIDIEGLPTDTNRDAAVKPNKTSLILACSQETVFEHVNNNPPPKPFVWKQSDCGKVTLEIKVGALDLKSEWPDFPSFIRDFKNNQGKKVFYRREFDFQKRGQFTGYGINYISVNYKFSPGNQVGCVLGGGPAKKPPVPDNIIEMSSDKR